jgi:hypothetical protein
MFNRTTSTFSELGVLCAFARECSYPIPLSYRAKTPRSQRGIDFPWRPLRLCARMFLSDSSFLSRQDAKIAKMGSIFLGALCAFSRGLSCPVPELKLHGKFQISLPRLKGVKVIEGSPRGVVLFLI